MKENEKKQSGWAPLFLAVLLLMAVFSVSLASCDSIVGPDTTETYEPGTNTIPDPDCAPEPIGCPPP